MFSSSRVGSDWGNRQSVSILSLLRRFLTYNGTISGPNLDGDGEDAGKGKEGGVLPYVVEDGGFGTKEEVHKALIR